MADEESDEVRRTARSALNTISANGKALVCTVCMYVKCKLVYVCMYILCVVCVYWDRNKVKIYYIQS